MAGDDEEARRRRAQRLRRRSRELAEGRFPQQPPSSPHEFIERETRDREGAGEARVSMDVPSLIREAARCRGRYEGLVPMYRNDGAIDDLFQWTLNFAELRSSVEQATTTTIEAAAEAAVDTGPIISLFVKLKAGLKGSASVADTVKTVATEDNRLNLLAVAEAVLERRGELATDPALVEPRPYFRYRDTFSCFAPGQEAELLAALGAELGGPVVDRWRTDAQLFGDTPQFVYATREPQPIAAILMAPPNEDKRIAGSSSACYPSFDSRVYFGRFGGVQKGVRFVNVMYYVADGSIA